MRERQTGHLRKGRISIPGARYFVTCCALRPTNALVIPPIADLIQSAMHRLDIDGNVQTLCSMLMPDHVHLLFELKGALSVGQVVGKMKALTRKHLAMQGVAWQSNFFEHRLRPDEPVDAYARYIFMNPYRAGLAERTEIWPFWRVGLAVDFDFLSMLDGGGCPPAEWIAASPEDLGLDRGSVGPD